MQTKAALDKLSRLRAALRDALKELETDAGGGLRAFRFGERQCLRACPQMRQAELALAPKGSCTAAWFSVGVIRARRV